MPGAPSEADLEAAARRLGAALLERGWQIGCAESSTAGLLSAALADIPGSSAYLRGSLVAYANDLKESLLGVPGPLLAEHGAVSREVAAAMAAGACRALRVDLGLAITGIAGPDGGSASKPVGLHFIAACAPATASTVERRVFPFDRNTNRRAAALVALELGLAMVGGA